MDMTGFSEELRGNEALQGFDAEDKTSADLAQAYVDMAGKAAEDASTSFLDKLPEELKTEENLAHLKDMDSPDKLALAFIDLKGQKPTGTIPEKEEDYETGLIPPEDKREGVDLEAAHAFDQALRPVFAKHKAPQELVTDLVGVTQQIGQAQEVAAIEAAKNRLVNYWPGVTATGDSKVDYEMEIANRTLDTLCEVTEISRDDPDTKAFLKNPVGAIMLAYIGKHTRPGAFGGGAAISVGGEETIEEDLKKQFPD